MTNFDIEGRNDKTPDPISSSEILSRLNSGDFVGRNTWNRGLTGDVEELLGWHLNDINSSPLNQQDRIRILRQIVDTSASHEGNSQADELKSWAEGRVVDIMTDEADRYLKERTTLHDLQETPEVSTLIQEIETLSKSTPDSEFTWTSNKVTQDTGYKEHKHKVSIKWNQIKQKKLELYKLIYEK